MTLSADVIGAIVGALLTLLVLSYLIYDTPLYRAALHILVGATIGYGVAVTTYTAFMQMVLPALQAEVGTAERASIVFPLVLGLLLLLKGFPRSRFVDAGNLSTAFLIGVGAAVAVAGALLGTISTQVAASNSLFGALLTVSVLLAFTLTMPRQPTLQRWWEPGIGLFRTIGQIVLAIAFGATFATVLTASLSILIQRIYFLANSVMQWLQLLMGG